MVARDCGHATSFGAALRQLRRQAGLREQDLADAAGIDLTYVSKIECGAVNPPGVETILAFARRLTADPDELLRLAGRVAPDLLAWLLARPERIQELRRYQSHGG